MLKEASSTLNLSIISLTDRRRLGQVLDFVHDARSGKILAFLIRRGGFFREPKIISTLDVLDIIDNYLVVESDEAIGSSSEVIRISHSLKNKIKILDNKVKTEKGEVLGKVKDFIFEVPGYNLVKLYIRRSLFSSLTSGEITLPASKIKKITKKAIIVSDDVIKGEKVREAEVVGAATS